MNCIRLLTRILPYIFEEPEWRGFFWSDYWTKSGNEHLNNNNNTNSSSSNNNNTTSRLDSSTCQDTSLNVASFSFHLLCVA